MGLKEEVMRELGDRDPMGATVDESAVSDPLFTEILMPQMLKCFTDKGPVAAASRTALMAFQAGMLYERSRAGKAASAREREEPEAETRHIPGSFDNVVLMPSPDTE